MTDLQLVEVIEGLRKAFLARPGVPEDRVDALLGHTLAALIMMTRRPK